MEIREGRGIIWGASWGASRLTVGVVGYTVLACQLWTGSGRRLQPLAGVRGDNKPRACAGMKRVHGMSEPLAYFLTWTTYGTWLPGDSRGWVNRHSKRERVVEAPCPALESHARGLMNDPPVVLDPKMREVADTAMRQACRELSWAIHALEVRSNHVHVVVTACDASPGKVMGILKVRGTQALNALRLGGDRDRWWTREGSKRILNSPASVDAAISYVKSQDGARTKG